MVYNVVLSPVESSPKGRLVIFGCLAAAVTQTNMVKMLKSRFILICQVGSFRIILLENVIQNGSEAETGAKKLVLNCFRPVAHIVIRQFGAYRSGIVYGLAYLISLFSP